MPLHMEACGISDKLDGAKSVLIVSCPICPPISLAMQRSTPFIEFFKHGLNTEAFEEYITSIREPLEQSGVHTSVFRTYIPSPTMCLWTQGQRGRFRKRAEGYDAVVVLGCDTARYTVQKALEGMHCRVVQAMRTVGMTNAALKFRLPMTITLEDKVRIGQKDEIEELA